VADRTLVLGEALIDVVRGPDGTVREHVGGSPANVAVGLARLGHDVELATHIGADPHGQAIADLLEEEGISLATGSVVETSTPVAEAVLDAAGAASYHFEISWDLPAGLPTAGAAHVHTGSYAAVVAPGANAVLAAVRAAREASTISYDPNARPSLMGDAAAARIRVEQLVALSDVVKASDEDIAWLYGGAAVPEVLRRWGVLGAPLTVVTRGREGAIVSLSAAGELAAVAAVEVAVVDTVGAGDSFMSGLLSGLLDSGLLGSIDARSRLRAATLADVRPAVDRAMECAALAVSRAGANPPRRGELT
jgi:fructokinase